MGFPELPDAILTRIGLNRSYENHQRVRDKPDGHLCDDLLIPVAVPVSPLSID